MTVPDLGKGLGLLLAIVLPLTGQPSEATKRLLERNKMFEPAVVRVAENVYTAIGYQVSANSMIVGSDGVIIVDPGQMPSAASKVRAAFEKNVDQLEMLSWARKGL